jgi:hypothetical protein
MGRLSKPVPTWLTIPGEFHGRVTAHDRRPWNFTTGIPPASNSLNFALAG